MAQLAIKGHPTRGSEIIALLEMLGGNNKYHINIIECHLLYTIREGDNAIICTYPNRSISQIYTLEEFLEKFPYKVGDKVIYEDKIREVTKMVWEEQTNTVAYKLDDKLYCNVIKELQPYKEETMEETKEKCDLINFNSHHIFDFADRVELVLKDDWDVKNEGGRTYVVRKKPKYPKTYEECCEVLNIHPARNLQPSFFTNLTQYEKDLAYTLNESYKLLICRDAYWKIAGDWMPDWSDSGYSKHTIRTVRNIVHIDEEYYSNRVLAFPTEEMRDAFWENFKELIENCKELL